MPDVVDDDVGGCVSDESICISNNESMLGLLVYSPTDLNAVQYRGTALHAV